LWRGGRRFLSEGRTRQVEREKDRQKKAHGETPFSIGWTDEISSHSMLPVFGSVARQETSNQFERNPEYFGRSCSERK
jgi:hypothetical protein